MFVDIAGASEVSNHLTTKDYAEFVSTFQTMFVETCSKYVDRWLDEYKDHTIDISARGDEGIFMAFPEDDDVVATIIDVVIQIALELKRMWLVGDWNKAHRIDQGILPVDIAVGIHVGPTYLKPTDGSKLQPEGYAINLAKRIEASSRSGGYSRIFVSEAAHGRLNTLCDEVVYVFDEPRAIEAKGFSRDIRAFEVMHHFLPTDWSEDLDKEDVAVRSRSGLDPLTDDQMECLKNAQKLNPTNIWLAEECIRSSMLIAYGDLALEDRSNSEELRKAFEYASEIATYLAQGDQRDTGVLMIQGLIDGECLDFRKERQRYRDARNMRKQITLLDWYEGYSYSNEVFYAIDGDNLGDDLQNKTYEDLSPCQQDLVCKAKKHLREASENSPWSAWIRYTYGCELVQWSVDVKETERGVAEVVHAAERLEQIREELSQERYLLKVQSHDKIKALNRKD